MLHQNILVKSKPPESWWVKLGDFGLTKRAGDGGTVSSGARGTLDYMAPELHGFIKSAKNSRSRDDKASDIWSLGVIVCRLVAKNLPFEDVADMACFVATPTSYLSGYFEACDIDIDISGKDFIQAMMMPEPKERLDAGDALLHAWLENHRILETDLSNTALGRYGTSTL
jgi:serine/threonine protein kinase